MRLDSGANPALGSVTLRDESLNPARPAHTVAGVADPGRDWLGGRACSPGSATPATERSSDSSVWSVAALGDRRPAQNLKLALTWNTADTMA
jgi:hypothetical protein